MKKLYYTINSNKSVVEKDLLKKSCHYKFDQKLIFPLGQCIFCGFCTFCAPSQEVLCWAAQLTSQSKFGLAGNYFY